MPTYDYQCRSCGTITEVVHSMTEDGPTACPMCGGSLRRVIHPTGIIFKGSGFYKTDSRQPKAGSTSSLPAGAASTTSATSGGSEASPTGATPSVDAGGGGSPKKTSTPSDGNGS